MNYEIKKTHISGIMAGDTIMCGDGLMRTVCKNNIKRGGFCGTTIFGDSFIRTQRIVDKIIILKAT